MIFTLKTLNKNMPLVEPFVNGSFLYRKINFNFKEIDGVVGYDQVIIPPDKFNYDGLVNILISEKYPSDRMQAIINNYLLDSVEGKKEFDEMQSWRLNAKQIAKNSLNFKN